MAARIKDIDHGMQETLRRMTDKANHVDIGLQSDEDEILLKIAAAHEFGATINIPARSQQIFRKINKDGSFNQRTGSRFVKKDKSNYSSWVTIEAYTITIPERSFIRSTVDENEEKYYRKSESVMGKIIDGQLDKFQALSLLGQLVEGDIKSQIINLDSPPNAASTIRKKGSANPLVDKDFLGGAIRYAVVE